MKRSLGQLAKAVNGQLVGDPETIITGLSGIKEAGAGDLTFLANAKYLSLLEKTKASAILVPRDMLVPGRNSIQVDNPSWAFSKIISLFFETQARRFQGIHSTAVIADEVALGKEVCVGPYTVIEKGARIGDRTVIYSGCFIGHDTTIGSDSLIYPHVSIREWVTIGNKVIIHSGTVIGSDGFGFVNIQGVHEKIPQIGTVVIEDDVEIGANVTVDRARFDKTSIGRGTKIDNLVQIAHNVCIGKNCIIVSQVGISGSTIVEDNVILAGQVGLAGHITIGEGSIVAAKSGVPNSVPPRTMVWGIPAKPHMQAKRVNACIQRLPQVVQKIQALEKRIQELEIKFNVS